MSFYLVVCRVGETREYIPETHLGVDTTREDVINDLMSGAYDRPLRVLEISEPRNVLCGWVLDVSETIALEILRRSMARNFGLEEWSRRRDLQNFCEEHAGVATFNEAFAA